MAGFDLNKLYQYAADADLLSAALAEQERALWELEYLAQGSQSGGNADITNRLNLVRAQILLFERLLVGKNVDSLVLLIHHYTAISTQPQ